jgi:hypothetical protein
MKSLKICVTVVAEFITASIDVLDDKKIKFSEIFGLVPHMAKIPSFIKNLPLAIIEIKQGVSEEYLSEIREEVKKTIDVDSEKVEMIVEEIVSLLIYTFALVGKIANSKSK